ncbi:MAG: phosphatase PAP2 family protein [Oscillospiraceae bacterium]|nr:phosphatase PAP2 family protein [Oscillospiraceae bacterium]
MDILGYLAEHFDLPILDWIMANLWCPFLDAVMPVITVLGDAGIFWIALAAVFLLLPKHRKMGLSMGVALMMGLVICNMILKPVVGRIRPYDYQLEFFQKTIPLLIERQHDFSFPSGHTIASFEAAVAMLICNKKLGIPAMILAVLIAFSRMYLYVHYPTDVIASVILGTGLAFLAVFLVNKGWALWETRKNKA